jgi:archaeal flagellin FlaB
MFAINRLNRDEQGQAALEAAIILIAFIVVASVFAFAILSAGSASTEKGEAAIYSGLEGVQSSMNVIGTVIGESTAANQVNNVVFTLGLVSGGEPIDMSTTNRVVLISYRDAANYENITTWTVTFPVHTDGAAADDMLEEGERAEVTAPIPVALGPKTAFTLEIKPPSGAVLQLNRTTPAAIDTFMDLR